MSDEILHIYSQGAWHDPVYITGTRGALKRLRELLTTVLWGDQSKRENEFWTSDGEGYGVRVFVVTPEQAGRLVMPYSEGMAQDTREGTLKPWEGDT